MSDRHSPIQRVTRTKVFYLTWALLIFIVVISDFALLVYLKEIKSLVPTNQYASVEKDTSTGISVPQLLGRAVFRSDEQSVVFVYPRHNDDSTNIAFYAECPTEACPNNGTLESPEFVFFAEALGHGKLPFSDYWAPDPSFRKLVAVEYFNEGQQFSCSNLSLTDCVANARFVDQFSFEITENIATTTAMVVATTTLDISATTTLFVTASSTQTTETTNPFSDTAVEPTNQSTGEGTATTTISGVSTTTPFVTASSTQTTETTNPFSDTAVEPTNQSNGEGTATTTISGVPATASTSEAVTAPL